MPTEQRFVIKNPFAKKYHLFYKFRWLRVFCINPWLVKLLVSVVHTYPKTFDTSTQTIKENVKKKKLNMYFGSKIMYKVHWYVPQSHTYIY